jgi:hypothetical protein
MQRLNQLFPQTPSCRLAFIGYIDGHLTDGREGHSLPTLGGGHSRRCDSAFCLWPLYDWPLQLSFKENGWVDTFMMELRAGQGRRGSFGPGLGAG